MNREVLETQWPQIREILSKKFSNLTDEDIRQINGQYDQLVAKLQQKYGYTREEAEERIRSWNFDRFDRLAANPRETIIHEDKVKREEDYSSILKWLLALGIPLLLIGSYFLSTSRAPEVTSTAPPVVREQMIVETPADSAISNGLRDALRSDRTLAAEMPNFDIRTQNGVVTLSGTVSSREMRDFIGTTAQNFAGVKTVNNNLLVK